MNQRCYVYHCWLGFDPAAIIGVHFTTGSYTKPTVTIGYIVRPEQPVHQFVMDQLRKKTSAPDDNSLLYPTMKIVFTNDS